MKGITWLQLNWFADFVCLFHPLSLLLLWFVFLVWILYLMVDFRRQWVWNRFCGYLLVVYFRANWRTSQPKLQKTKKITSQKIPYISGNELFSSNIKKILIFSQKKVFLIFSQKKVFLIFPEEEPCTFQPKLKE